MRHVIYHAPDPANPGKMAGLRSILRDLGDCLARCDNVDNPARMHDLGLTRAYVKSIHILLEDLKELIADNQAVLLSLLHYSTVLSIDWQSRRLEPLWHWVFDPLSYASTKQLKDEHFLQTILDRFGSNQVRSWLTTTTRSWRTTRLPAGPSRSTPRFLGSIRASTASVLYVLVLNWSSPFRVSPLALSLEVSKQDLAAVGVEIWTSDSDSDKHNCCNPDIEMQKKVN